MSPHDPTDEPSFVTPEDDESMLDPPREHEPGFDWWLGSWPKGGVHSLDDLETWLEERLSQVIGLTRYQAEKLGPIWMMLGHQAAINAIRYLARFGKTPPPKRPKPDQLESLEDIEELLESILRHIRQERDSVPKANERANQDGGRPGRGKAKKGPPKRSWTQGDLDLEILKYKADRAGTFKELEEGVRAGLEGAKKAARRIFGRNAIADALGVKSRAMVSKSHAWIDIGDRLGLRRSEQRGPARLKRVGLGIALEEVAVVSTENPFLKNVITVNEETIRLIRRTMPEKFAELTIESLRQGEISDDQAREIVAMYRDRDKV